LLSAPATIGEIAVWTRGPAAGPIRSDRLPPVGLPPMTHKSPTRMLSTSAAMRHEYALRDGKGPRPEELPVISAVSSAYHIPSGLQSSDSTTLEADVKPGLDYLAVCLLGGKATTPPV